MTECALVCTRANTCNIVQLGTVSRGLRMFGIPACPCSVSSWQQNLAMHVHAIAAPRQPSLTMFLGDSASHRRISAGWRWGKVRHGSSGLMFHGIGGKATAHGLLPKVELQGSQGALKQV